MADKWFQTTEGNMQQPTTLALYSTTVRTQLQTGRWVISSDVDCWFRQGNSTVTATTGTTYSRPLWQKTYRPFDVTYSGNNYIAGIVASGSGTLYADPRFD